MISPDKQYDCPIKLTLDAIGGKYKSLIIWQLNHKTVRFNALHRHSHHGSHVRLGQGLYESI